MKYLLLFISILTLGHCRPGNVNQTSEVEVEKQTIVKLPKDGKRSADTLDILKKIAQVNLKQGLIRTQDIGQKLNTPKSDRQFEFSNSPFTNPIFDYLGKTGEGQSGVLTRQSLGPGKDEEKIPDGYGVIRKVTHQQTVVVPSFYQQPPDPYYNQMFVPPPEVRPYQSVTGHYGLVKDTQNSTQNSTSMDELNQAKQNYLINNIKNIISHSQAEQLYPANLQPYNPNQGFYQIFNPYANLRNQPHNQIPEPFQFQPQQFYPYQQYAPSYNPYQVFAPYQNLRNNLHNPTNQFSDTYYANLQTAKKLKPAPEARQGGPFAQYFPIIVRNPFQQIFQAFTSMVEYGPDADVCRRKVESARSDRTGKSIALEQSKPKFKLTDDENNTDLAIQRIEESTEPLEDDVSIEDLQILSKDNVDLHRLKPKQFFHENKLFNSLKTTQPPQKQNSSTGIFIQRLKVRKGGVAIAGPGGIATAGSGGTAIVGPNGIAYTQTNGIAIAGPGSKVISVDPSVDLSEFIRNITKGDESTSRLGKVVAVGPVIYRDLGQN